MSSIQISISSITVTKRANRFHGLRHNTSMPLPALGAGPWSFGEFKGFSLKICENYVFKNQKYIPIGSMYGIYTYMNGWFSGKSWILSYNIIMSHKPPQEEQHQHPKYAKGTQLNMDKVHSYPLQWFLAILPKTRVSFGKLWSAFAARWQIRNVPDVWRISSRWPKRFEGKILCAILEETCCIAVNARTWFPEPIQVA